MNFKMNQTIPNRDFSYEQILKLVMNLPKKQKNLLASEIARDTQNKSLINVLDNLKNDEIDLKEIDSELDSIRSSIYESKKH